MKCPTCKRPIAWTDDFPQRPFCSERCRLVDFGAWVSGVHAIPGEPLEDDSSDRDLQPGSPDRSQTDA